MDKNKNKEITVNKRHSRVKNKNSRGVATRVTTANFVTKNSTRSISGNYFSVIFGIITSSVQERLHARFLSYSGDATNFQNVSLSVQTKNHAFCLKQKV